MTRRRKIILGVVIGAFLVCGIPAPWTITGAANALIQRGVGDVATPAHPTELAERSRAARSRRNTATGSTRSPRPSTTSHGVAPSDATTLPHNGSRIFSIAR
jgi:hypothetical protein